MSTNEISLLRDLIDRLDHKPFDLQSWKTNAIMILGRIFGENSQKVEMIRSIQPDFSSWSLRDATGRLSQLDACRKMGREVLEAVIAELEAFGPPVKRDPSGSHNLLGLEDFITGKQAREIAQIITSDQPDDDKVSKISELIKDLDQVDLLAAIARMLIYKS